MHAAPSAQLGVDLILYGLWVGGDYYDVGVAAAHDRQHGFRCHRGADIVQDDQQGFGGSGHRGSPLRAMGHAGFQHFLTSSECVRTTAIHPEYSPLEVGVVLCDEINNRLFRTETRTGMENLEWENRE